MKRPLLNPLSARIILAISAVALTVSALVLAVAFITPVVAQLDVTAHEGALIYASSTGDARLEGFGWTLDALTWAFPTAATATAALAWAGLRMRHHTAHSYTSEPAP